MKKVIFLALSLLLIALAIGGCSNKGESDAGADAMPGLTPIVTIANAPSTNHTQTSSSSKSGQTLIVVGANNSSPRPPILIHVPLTPALPADQTASISQTPAAASNSAQNTPVPTPIATKTPSSATPEPHHGVQVSLDDTFNILVIGSDERKPGKPWRADVIMLVAIDYAHRQIGIISFPRDLWVTIPTVGENRINTATFFGKLNNYPNGGDIGLLKDTLEQNFGLRVDNYIKFNFETFKDLIDAMDGIDIEVTKPLTGNFPVKPGSSRLEWKTLEPGMYHMDGELALRYVRERKTTSDVDRNRRQQQVLVAMRKRALEVNIIPRIPALYDAMRENIVTDLGLTDIIALTRLGLQIDMKDVHGFNIGYKEATSWTTPGGASVLRPNMAKIQEGINKLFVEKPTLEENSTPK